MKEQTSGSESLPIRGGQRISLTEAIKRSAIFRDEYVHKKFDREEHIKANYFSKESIDEIFRQPGCCGLRIYNAVNPDGTDPLTGIEGHVRELILVGTDKEGNDILTTADYSSSGKSGKGCNLLSALIALPASPQQVGDAVLMANPLPCPNMCGKANGLNGLDME